MMRVSFTILGFLWFGVLLSGQSLTLTLDDAPALGPTPHMTVMQRQKALLEALKAERVRVAIFVNGIDGGDTPEGRTMLEAWGKAGHRIGNHTYHHLNLDRVPLEAYEEDFTLADELINPLPGYWRMFRFTYLKEGNTTGKRDHFRSFLAKAGYRNARVTMTSFDWLIDEHLRAALKRNPKLGLAPYREFYLQHLLRMADYYRGLAQTVVGRDIPQALLLHHNLLNALFMKDLIVAFRRQGWSFVDPETAYQDPIYAQQPRALTQGDSFLWQLAAEHPKGKPMPQSVEKLFQEEKRLLAEAGL